MKINIKKIAGGSLLALTVITGSVVGYAQTNSASQTEQKSEKRWEHRGDKGFRHDKRGGEERMFGGINLTDAQKEQMKQIAERYRESTRNLREQMRAARGQNELKNDGTFNEAAFRAALEAQNKIRVELAVAHAKMRAEMFSVLTAEQKARLEQFREQRQQQRLQRRGLRKAERSS